MNLKKPELARAPLGRLVREYFEILPWKDPVEWAKEAIDFSDDLSAERSRLDLGLSPFLVDPIREWDFRGRIKQVTVVGIQQHGKSLCWVVGLLYSMVYNPRKQSLVVYPSDDLAEENNLTKLKPLMRHIPQLARQLDLPRTCRQDRYNFSNNVSYFSGSGRKIMSKSCAIRVADQLDQWSAEYPGNLADLRKRGRSYSESILYEVCSPTMQDGRIWKQFLAGSRGYWTLRCQGCGQLTMKSCDLNNLQFQSQKDEALDEWRAKPESVRLVCPVCRHQHKQSDRRAMNLQGAYVHEAPERLEAHPSYQFGALASQLPYMSWARIADQILRAGRRADIEQQKTLDNSFKGLPWKRRKILHQTAETLARKAWGPADAPRVEDLEMVFVTADTMDQFFRWAAWGWSKNEDLYMLQAGQVKYLNSADAPPEEEKLSLDWVMAQEYAGVKPLWCLIDTGGHRSRQVSLYILNRSNILGQKGSALKNEVWYLSKNQHKLVISNSRYWQGVALHYLTEKPREEGGSRLFLPPGLAQKYIEQLAAMKPDNSSKNGHIPENWTPGGAADHTFDCLKYAYMAIDIAVKTFGSSKFRLNEAKPLKDRASGRKPAPKVAPKGGWLH